MIRILALLVLLLSTVWTESIAYSTDFTFQANCICEANDGYINAHFIQPPFGLNVDTAWFKDGDTATISAGPCTSTVVLCKVRSLSGIVRIQVKGSNYSSSSVYKFSVHGLRAK